MAIKIKVKATGNDARKIAAVASSKPDASGANFVSDNSLHRIDAASKGKSVAPSGQTSVGDTLRRSNAAIVADKFPALHIGDAQVKHELDCREVQPVSNHELHENAPETIRRRNNRARDMRTNLGKSRPMLPVGE